MAVNRNFDAKKTTKAATDGCRLMQIEKEITVGRGLNRGANLIYITNKEISWSRKINFSDKWSDMSVI
ncbi:MAG: hypothetical protein HY096_02260 [Nitrospinae bacterium]|nr:hypothetical protein [Nitrospinota bacterium]